MPADWPVVDLRDWTLAGAETQGLHPHDWFRHPEQERTWLFKESTVDHSRPFHQHLVERLASEIAVVMGVPAARVSLGVRGQVTGCLVEDLRLSGGSHNAGQELMPAVVEGYDPDDPEHRGHSLDNIKLALRGFGAPPHAGCPTTFDGFDVFAGYLVFDALIANTDRHDRNWAVLRPPPGSDQPDRLCGSYDHASSLGFNLSDVARSEHLTAGSVAGWARHGFARQFEKPRGAPRTSLVELAVAGLSLCSPEVKQHWLDATSGVTSEIVHGLLARLPGLSEVSGTFTAELLLVNRRRLLGED